WAVCFEKFAQRSRATRLSFSRERAHHKGHACETSRCYRELASVCHLSNTHHAAAKLSNAKNGRLEADAKRPLPSWRKGSRSASLKNDAEEVIFATIHQSDAGDKW